jgi:predicted AlkP superfamily pyrophosphatase or phosphodiesterase
MSRLIVIMLDGISADSFARRRAYMPHLARLAERGLVVERLAAEVCGTSFPGRTSIVTGALASESGIYANLIWDGSQFRHATPDDVRVETLPAKARRAGRSSAVIGYGMVRPEDADLYKAPWWATNIIQRSRDAFPLPTTYGWRRAVEHLDGQLDQHRLRAGLQPFALPDLDDKLSRAAMGDMQIINLATAVATAPDAPDLVMTEVLLPDTAQHYAGYDTPQALWSFSYADSLVGHLLAALELAGVEEYTLAVLSDHGHAPIEKALYPEAIIPNTTFACEGSMLHVVTQSAAALAETRARLAEFGVLEYSNEHLPPEQRQQVHCFLAPESCSFEYDPAQAAQGPIGEPRLRSSHGLRPGHPGDERFMVMVGPQTARQRLPTARASQVAPTLAAALGISPDSFADPPLLEPASVGV